MVSFGSPSIQCTSRCAPRCSGSRTSSPSYERRRPTMSGVIRPAAAGEIVALYRSDMKAGQKSEQPSSVKDPRKVALLWLAVGLSILLWFIWKTVNAPPPTTTPRLDAPGQLLNEPGSAAWTPVPGFRLAHVAALSLSTQTDRGAAVSSRGVLLETTDGGQTWSPA